MFIYISAFSASRPCRVSNFCPRKLKSGPLSHRSMANSEYRCCCNTHVHNAVIATAILSLFGGGAAFFFVVFSLQWLFLPLPILAGFGNLMLLLGRCTRTACLYWIYFIAQIFYILGCGFWCLFVFATRNAIVKGRFDEDFFEDPRVKRGLGAYLAVIGGIGIIYTFFNLYVFHIAVKSYKYLTRVLSIPEQHVDSVVTTVPVPPYAPTSHPSAPTFSPEASPRQPLEAHDYHAQPFSQAPVQYPPYEAPPSYEQHMYPILPKTEF